MVSIRPIIDNVTLVQVDQCQTVPDSKDSYKKVARNRLNRNKPKFLGNLVFAPIIFDALFNVESYSYFVLSLGDSMWCNIE